MNPPVLDPRLLAEAWEDYRWFGETGAMKDSPESWREFLDGVRWCQAIINERARRQTSRCGDSTPCRRARCSRRPPARLREPDVRRLQ